MIRPKDVDLLHCTFLLLIKVALAYTVYILYTLTVTANCMKFDCKVDIITVKRRSLIASITIVLEQNHSMVLNQNGIS